MNTFSLIENTSNNKNFKFFVCTMRTRYLPYEIKKLTLAVSNNNFEKARKIIERNKEIYWYGEYRGPSFLVEAIRRAATEEIALFATQMLITLGHNPKSHHGRAFGVAARRGFSRVMDALKQHGADIYAGNMYATIWALRKYPELLTQTIDENYKAVFVNMQNSSGRRCMIRRPQHWRRDERHFFLEDDEVLAILKDAYTKTNPK